MRVLLSAVAAVSLGACVDMSSPDLGSDDSNVEIHNKLAANKLAANKLAANKLAANKLAANSLSSTRLVALDDTAEILGSASGREVYSYIVSCALDLGTTIEKAVVTNYCSVDSTTGAESCGPTPVPFPTNDPYCTPLADPTTAHCVYPGGVGLATDWADKKLGNAGQGWISACLFARSNLYDIGVGISMRGRHPALATEPSEQQNYSLQEGAFYGNVFTGVDRRTGLPNDIEWFACRGQDEWRVSTGELPDSGGLALRDCTDPDGDTGKTKCGFTYTGNCADYTAASEPYACRTVDDLGNYTECAAEARDGHFGGVDQYRQVITVWLRP